MFVNEHRRSNTMPKCFRRGSEPMHEHGGIGGLLINLGGKFWGVFAPGLQCWRGILGR